MRPLFFLGAAIVSSLGATLTFAQSNPPDVIVSVRPIHSLAAAVMDGVAEPKLLLDGGQSPHSYNLTPSDARDLSEADMVVWVGEPLETFLERPLTNLASNAMVIQLIDAPGLVLLDNREGGVWDLNPSGDTHDHDHDHDHGHNQDHAHDHNHGETDGHIWLSPQNARAIANQITQALSELDPSNASQYQDNAAALIGRLEVMEKDIQTSLADVKSQPFLTAHDALQYFDQYFGLSAAGALAVTPDRAPSAKRLSEIRDRAQELGSLCLLTEPGFEPGVMRVIEDAASVRIGKVDPLGIEVEQGPNLYVELMVGIARALSECLKDR